MKLFIGAIILFAAVLSYAQTGATGANGAPVGAYKPGMKADSPDDPADRPPQAVLDNDPKFAARLQKLLPAQITPQKACDGFKKLSDCVSAIHAAINLEIPLDNLKSKMLAEKGHDALEKSIHELKPNVDAKVERKKAQKQAERDMPVSD